MAVESTGEKKLFARRASGLVRVIGPFSALAFGVHNTSLSYSGTITLSWIPALFPGVNAYWVLLIGGIWCAIQGTNYAMVGTLMPRAGADYVFNSRIWRPDLSFALSFVYVIYSAITSGTECGMNSWWFSMMFQTLGRLYDRPEWIGLAQWFVSSPGYWTTGIITAIGLFILMIMPTKIVVNYMNVTLILGNIMYGFIMAPLVLCTPAQWAAGWNAIMGAGNFEAVIPAAANAGMTFVTDPTQLLIQTFNGAGLATFWIYYGWHIPTIFSGEVKEVEKSLVIAAWGTIFNTNFWFGAEVWAMNYLTSITWVASEAFLSSTTVIGGVGTGPGGLATGAWPALYALAGMKGLGWPRDIIAWQAIFINVNELLLEIALPACYWFYSSRLFFAFAFDRILPEKIAYLHPTLRSPVGAMVVMFIISWIGIYMQAMVVAFPMAFIYSACLVWILASVCTIVLRWRNRPLYDAAPWWIRKWNSLEIIGLITLVVLLWNVLGIWVFLPPTAGALAVTPDMLYYMAALIIVGFAIFHGSRVYRLKKEGFDLMDTFKAIPPA
jgi:amino acid transporter